MTAPETAWAEVTQSILWTPELQAEGIHGNCMQVAVASVLRLPLDAVPHFSAYVWWPQAMELWARGHSLTVKGEKTDAIPDRLCIVGGASPRGAKGGHVVVGYGGEVVWDPHPSRDGLVTIEDVLWFEPWPEPESVCWFCQHPWCRDQEGEPE